MKLKRFCCCRKAMKWLTVVKWNWSRTYMLTIFFSMTISKTMPAQVWPGRSPETNAQYLRVALSWHKAQPCCEGIHFMLLINRARSVKGKSFPWLDLLLPRFASMPNRSADVMPSYLR